MTCHHTQLPTDPGGDSAQQRNANQTERRLLDQTNQQNVSVNKRCTQSARQQHTRNHPPASRFGKHQHAARDQTCQWQEHRHQVRNGWHPRSLIAQCQAQGAGVTGVHDWNGKPAEVTKRREDQGHDKQHPRLAGDGRHEQHSKW